MLAFIEKKKTRRILKTQIKILKASHGDCILIKTYTIDGNEFVILMDGGTASTFDYSLKAELKEINKIDLMILSHIDSDHIAGFIRFLKNSLFNEIEIKKYWINSPNLIKISSGNKISYNQGKQLDELLIEKGELSDKVSAIIAGDRKVEIANGIEATILSPRQKEIDNLNRDYPLLNAQNDNSIANVPISASTVAQLDKGTLKDLANLPFLPSKTIDKDIFNSSSIAFLLKMCDCSILLLGDSRSEVVEEAIKKLGKTGSQKLKVDYVKVSHHGSKNNTSSSLLDLIECDNYIISTNGGNGKSKHPDRETIARIVHHKERDYTKTRTVFFNYSLKEIERKAGKFINENDLSDGNWKVDDTNKKLPE